MLTNRRLREEQEEELRRSVSTCVTIVTKQGPGVNFRPCIMSGKRLLNLVGPQLAYNFIFLFRKLLTGITLWLLLLLIRYGK